MKNIKQKIQKILKLEYLFFLLILLIAILYACFAYQESQKVKALLIEAEKPSKIEVSFAKLKKMEQRWENLEKIVQAGREAEAEKIQLEPQIRCQRNVVVEKPCEEEKKIEVTKTKKRQTKQKIVSPISKENIDIDLLAKCVALHETQDCKAKKGSALVNNCFGIMEFGSFGRRYKKYSSPEESYKDFNRIWTSYYGGIPTWEQAKRYSGNDRVNSWYNNVRSCYFSG